MSQYLFNDCEFSYGFGHVTECLVSGLDCIINHSFFTCFRCFKNSKILITMTIMLLPGICFAKPLSSDKTGSLIAQPQAIDIITGEKTQHNVAITKILHNMANIMNNKASQNNVSEQSKVRQKRWNANLLALTLYGNSKNNKREHRSRISFVSDYDPYGGGPWGKKKRSIPDEADFDYDLEGL